MKLISQVELPDLPLKLNHREQILMMGSCFADHMGQLLDWYRFPICLNPFGTLFNPLSVLKGLDALLHKESYTEEDLLHHQGSWFSFDHYTGFSRKDQEDCLQAIQASFLPAREALVKTRVLALTWGTSWIFRWKETGRVVSNCHKIPAARFSRHRLTPEEIAGAYLAFLPELFHSHPKLNVLLTVSPVRHLKDGAHGNQLSKGALLLAADLLQREFPDRLWYFPSYEIILDELRDYRFYAEDLVHPNGLATKYLWEKVRKTLIDEESQEIMDALEGYLKLREHKPRDTSPESLRSREAQLEQKANELGQKYPFIGM